MFRLSASTFREQWQLFLGSIITVAIGVGLVQSSLLILVTAATFKAPPELSILERAQLLDSYVLAIPVVGVTLALALFLTVFIVSSTFAFTVAQRRRDLALLRLAGGHRKQVRRLLLGEATLLGATGTALGVPLGVGLMQLQTHLLVSFELLPSGFQPEWRMWALAVSVAIGIGVALAGVLAASRRAGRVRPLEALRGTGHQARVMTAPRWFIGVFMLALAAALMIIAQSVDPSGAMPLLMLVTLAAATGLSTLSPLLVPVFGRVLGLLMRGRTIGTLASANLRDGARRSAATAAPLILLFGLLVGLFGASLSNTAAAEVTLQRDTAADLVVTSTVDEASRVSGVSGVASTSTETDVPLVMMNVAHDDDELGGGMESGDARVIDPRAYLQAHHTKAESGSLKALQGHAVALGPGRSGELGYSVGDTVHLTIGNREMKLPIVAALPVEPYGGPDLLLPKGIAPASVLTSATAQTFVSTEAGADRDVVGDDIRAAVSGTVDDVDVWVRHQADAAEDAQLRIFTILLGTASLYALFAAINAVVIAAADRRAEFAAARLSGLTRRQVVRMAVLESESVAAIGILLGGVAASAALLGMRNALERMTGVGIVELPWLAIAAIVAGLFLVVGLTSLATARSATRVNAVALVGDD